MRGSISLLVSRSQGALQLTEVLKEREAQIELKKLREEGLVRIGKAPPGKPRRLLVRLRSEEAASALLQAAPSLRRVSDPHVAANLLINADLSPAAAKLAYES